MALWAAQALVNQCLAGRDLKDVGDEGQGHRSGIPAVLRYATFLLLACSALLLLVSVSAILQMPRPQCMCYSVAYSDAAVCNGAPCCSCASIRQANAAMVLVWHITLVCEVAVGVNRMFVYAFLAICVLHGLTYATVHYLLRTYRRQSAFMAGTDNTERLPAAHAAADAALHALPPAAPPAIHTMSAELVLVLQPDYLWCHDGEGGYPGQRRVSSAGGAEGASQSSRGGASPRGGSVAWALRYIRTDSIAAGAAPEVQPQLHKPSLPLPPSPPPLPAGAAAIARPRSLSISGSARAAHGGGAGGAMAGETPSGVVGMATSVPGGVDRVGSAGGRGGRGPGNETTVASAAAASPFSAAAAAAAAADGVTGGSGLVRSSSSSACPPSASLCTLPVASIAGCATDAAAAGGEDGGDGRVGMKVVHVAAAVSSQTAGSREHWRDGGDGSNSGPGSGSHSKPHVSSCARTRDAGLSGLPGSSDRDSGGGSSGAASGAGCGGSGGSGAAGSGGADPGGGGGCGLGNGG